MGAVGESLIVHRIACWRHLYGAFTVWLDVNPDQSEDDAPQRGAYSEAEVQLHVKDADTAEQAQEEVVENIVAQVCLCSYLTFSALDELENQLNILWSPCIFPAFKERYWVWRRSFVLECTAAVP